RFDDGKTVTEVKPGDLVRVRLRVTAPTDREFVAMEDPLPAGLEVVDVSLKTSRLNAFISPESMQADEQRRAQAGMTTAVWSWFGGQSYNWWWSVWESSEMRDD